jgi:hypothetical protein
MASLYDTGTDQNLKRAKTHMWTRSVALGRTFPNFAIYLPLLIPIILFVSSLYIPPVMNADSSIGFLVLHSMLDGGAFNNFTDPDPANIANDVVTFLAAWSPGQYLLPGSLIWLGTDYGLALSLTTLIATLIGVVGWIQVARSFGVSSFVLSVFVLGLSTFSYVTLPFRIYTGGEVLLFAAAPWSLYAMCWAANQTPILSLTMSLISVALLFFVKLTGLVVFATNVGAISLLALSQRRLSSSTIAMWVASAIGALCFMMFWLPRGWVAASGSTFTFNWFPIWFSLTGVVFSGTSALECLGWFVGHPWVRIIPNFDWATSSLNYVFGPLGLLLVVWVWFRIRHTRYREMAVLLLSAILLYAIAVAAMYLRGAAIELEERHFRYAGILFFLLLLTAIDQWRVCFARGLAWAGVILLGFYGLKSSATGAYAQMRAGYSMSGIYQDIVSPAALEYMRSEITRNNVQRPVAVVPSPSTAPAALGLPRVRIIRIFPHLPLETSLRNKWAGHAEKIFVVMPEEMLLNGKAESTLRSFTGYELRNWRQTKIDRMIIYTQ